MWQPPAKPGGPSSDKPKRPHASCPQFEASTPALAWWLCASSWSDGSPKKSGRVSLNVFKDAFQVTFCALGTGLRLVLEIPSPEYLWEALDAALRMEVIPWEEDPFNPAVGAVKGKKK